MATPTDQTTLLPLAPALQPQSQPALSSIIQSLFGVCLPPPSSAVAPSNLVSFAAPGYRGCIHNFFLLVSPNLNPSLNFLLLLVSQNPLSMHKTLMSVI